MKLRIRLAVAALAAAAVTIAALLWIDRTTRREERAGRLIANLARVLANPDEQARCTASPATWRPSSAPQIGAVRITEFSDEHGHRVHVSVNGPGPRAFPPPPPPPLPGLDPQLEPIELVVRNSDLRPARPGAPALDDPIVRELVVGGAVSLPVRWWSDAVEVVLRTPAGDGPCAYVHARGHLRIFASRTPDSLPWLLPLAGVLCAVLLTMTPVVRRIRRLTDAVAGSAATGFVAAIPIEGTDEIAGLARSFVEASRAVRTQLSETGQREATLRDFLTNTTHDVMIPLTVLQAHLAAMQEDEQAGRPRRGEILTSAMDEAHYLGALLQNLAAIAKLDSGGWQPVISDMDMNALIQRVISRHQVIARRLDIAVEFAVPDEPIRAAADLTLLEQAVSNVVYNAVRHNRAGGHVAVVLEPAGADRFLLRVVDDGPGVPAGELARLVERGFRGNAARTRSPDGLGLGLDITSRVADLHRFDLRFTPSQYGGLQVDLEGLRLKSSQRTRIQ